MRSSVPTNAITLLRQEHRRLKGLFMAFGEGEDAAEQSDALETAIHELQKHLRLEKEVFFPALKKTVWAGPFLSQAEEDHEDLHAILQDLQEMEPEDSLFADKCVELEDRVLQHIRDTESDLFLQAEHADLDLDALGRSLLEHQDVLRKEKAGAKTPRV
jgi:iron-sulfur cluster repair protein YtfE (RIC family)